MVNQKEKILNDVGYGKDEIFEVEIPDISSKLIGKKVHIKGMIAKSTEILNERYKTSYECGECYNQVSVKGTKPWMCFKCKAKGVMRKIDEMFRDFRDIEIEETLENIDRQPERIRIRILGDLLEKEEIKKIQIGQLIDLIGIVDKEKIKVKNDREIYSYYLLASVLNIIDYSEKVKEMDEEDMVQIVELSKNNPLEMFSKCLAPNIFGYESIKKSIILQAIRGPETLKNVRPRIHILIVGEPATSKSKLAWEAHLKTPKSIYGSGDNMSSAGLSASVEKDELSGRWIARAGILCRANKSLVIIDEIDKLKSDDKKALHTPMEQGIIIVDKAGIHQVLNADCSILACCNPKKGSFDTSGYNAITEEVKLPEAIISRFDLIFYLRDEVDTIKDKKIIKSFFEKEEEIIKTDLFKKYINFASKIEPEISEEVKKNLEELYEKLRASSKYSNENKITARQAGGLIRLAVASAKIRLSSKVELKDLEIAEELMLDSLQSIGFARKLNSLDQASLYSNTTRKKMNVQTQLISLIKDLIISGNNTEKGLEESLLSKGFAMDLYKKVLDGLKRDGTILGNYNDLKWIN